MANVRDPFAEETESPSTLQPLLRSLWGYRRVMLLALGLLVAIVAGGLLVAYMLAPKERVAMLGVRLTFEGAEQDRFPNGTKFSSSEIVSTSVLTEVYRMNQLERYLSFTTFKESMFVLQSNPDLDMLSSEYQSKLADPKITPVDRSRLEEEFRKKRDSLRSAQYSLNFQRDERSITMPSTVMAKVLTDTITTWSHQAAEFKGAVRHDMPLLSKNVMNKEFLDAEDYVIAVDILRAKAERIVTNIGHYDLMPGAATARIGEEQLSLADVKVRLEDILRFKIEPLFARIRAGGLSRDPAAIARYFEARSFQLQLEREEASQRVKSLETALNAYLQRRSAGAADGSPAQSGERGGTVMPQLSESFIDRLVDMSSEANDRLFRQNLTNRIITQSVTLAQMSRQVDYYDSMRRSFAAGRTESTPEAGAEVKRAIDQAYGEVAKALDHVSQLYARIAEQHLNPSGVLYSVTSPFVVRTISAFPRGTAIRYFFGIVLLGALLIPILCLAFAYVRESVPTTAPRVRPEPPR